MKNLGYILITVGFLAGSYFSVIDTDLVQWSLVVPALLLGLAGVALVQIAIRVRSRAAHEVQSSISKLEGSLQRIVDNITRLDAEKNDVNVYQFHRRIDDLFMSDLDTFVDNRESIGHAFGLQTYADVMTHFATGERYLNRCWSASADGYIDEVETYLTRSRDQFGLARELLQSHTHQTRNRPQ
jgi:hypothetical protein